MLSDLYSDRILAAAAAIPPARRLPAPDASARKVSRVCGSEVAVDLALKDGRVADVGVEARACALGQASASIVARNIVGAAPAELFRLRDEMRAMLKEGGAAPSGARWRELEALSAIRDYPQRHASTMLIFEAVCEALQSSGRRDCDQA
ncbi:MAG TPA: iron-sulfur cluster assembly scaffold protein [Parvularcula sp.]|nr:iron-sulfur cluster assembly scaffold protein [Parvularcula sp.]HBS31463.1 iron-sulfur cluster assembly scaffold protein [Parvularcula sp.]HBS35190.1 iron-sulfur cluster assembly scaffold protein [Parvularcula sp.]